MTPAALREIADALDALGLLLVRATLDRTELRGPELLPILRAEIAGGAP